jgi:ribosome maturation factor RimP
MAKEVANEEAFVGSVGTGVWGERWISAAEAVIESMGYELVDVERAGRGLLRITLDSPNGIGVDDCEKVSHQLSHLLTVENIVYDRLEVSSPGVDRVLKRQRDFERFVGEEVWIRFRLPIGNRKQFSGRLVHTAEGGLAVEFVPEKKGEAVQILPFSLADLEAARLVPHLKF